MDERNKIIEALFRNHYLSLIVILCEWSKFSSLSHQDVENAVMESFAVILEYSTAEFEKKQKRMTENPFGFMYTITKRKLINKNYNNLYSN